MMLAMMGIGLMAALLARFRDGVVRHPVVLKPARRLLVMTFFGLACRPATERG